MRRIFSKFGSTDTGYGAQYDATTGQYLGNYQYVPGSAQDPAIIASKITDWSNVTDPLLCWRDPAITGFNAHPTAAGVDAWTAATNRCQYGTASPVTVQEATVNTNVSPVPMPVSTTPIASVVSNPLALGLPTSITNALPAPISNAISSVTQNPMLLLAVIGLALYFGNKK